MVLARLVPFVTTSGGGLAYFVSPHSSRNHVSSGFQPHDRVFTEKCKTEPNFTETQPFVR